jgi:hypothetical protein
MSYILTEGNRFGGTPPKNVRGASGCCFLLSEIIVPNSKSKNNHMLYFCLLKN